MEVDISTLSADELGDLRADLWLLSPSCQPYTVLNPLAKGAEDPRARSFLHLMEVVLPSLAAQQRHPRYMLIENVAGFEVNHRSTRSLGSLTFVSACVDFKYATTITVYLAHLWIHDRGTTADPSPIRYPQFPLTILYVSQDQTALLQASARLRCCRYGFTLYTR